MKSKGGGQKTPKVSSKGREGGGTKPKTAKTAKFAKNATSARVQTPPKMSKKEQAKARAIEQQKARLKALQKNARDGVSAEREASALKTEARRVTPESLEDQELRAQAERIHDKELYTHARRKLDALNRLISPAGPGLKQRQKVLKAAKQKARRLVQHTRKAFQHSTKVLSAVLSRLAIKRSKTMRQTAKFYRKLKKASRSKAAKHMQGVYDHEMAKWGHRRLVTRLRGLKAESAAKDATAATISGALRSTPALPQA